MSSNINPYNIDGTFPVAGQDNSSQGFRDNFTNIKNNFLFAESEISDLQAKALVTSALTGQTITNDMAGTQIVRPQLKAWTQALLDLGTISTSATLDFNAANFQKITTGGAISVSFINWPTTTGTGALGYGVMRVWFNVTSTAHTLHLPTSVTIGVIDIAWARPNGDGSYTITFDAPGNYLFDFSSIDGGNNYQIFDLSRNRSTLRDPGLYFNDTVNGTLLVNYQNGLSTALTLEQGQDSVSSLGSYNSVGVGNLGFANVAYLQTDTGGVAGYSVSAARGNIQNSNVQPVISNDLVGYVNSIAYTGITNSGNAFQQVASIDFFATGSNIAYGLGGNIAFFTADDGGSGQNIVFQALGIENDQSVKTFANTTVAGNLITQGGRIDSGYQYSAATNSFQITALPNVSRLILDPASDLTNGNITLPSGNVDARVITISSTANVAALAVAGNSGTVVKPSANVFLLAGTSITYFFHKIESKWYKIG
jgi:hypothetical protein